MTMGINENTVEHDIKTMKLYTNFERIEKELLENHEISLENLKKEGKTLDHNILKNYDCMHYRGRETVDIAIEKLAIKESSVVLDIGAGLGGVPRYISSLTKCTVVALELQEDVNEKARNLTSLCGFSQKVKHSHGSILEESLLSSLGAGLSSFNVITSWLCFLHIPNKRKLFSHCSKMLSTNGHMFIEDFYAKAKFTEMESAMLQTDVYCTDLPTETEYKEALIAAGFKILEWTDMTTDWTDCVINRATNYKKNKERTLRIHGQPTYDSQSYFYDSVAKLFQGGNLGGVRYLVVKK